MHKAPVLQGALHSDVPHAVLPGQDSREVQTTPQCKPQSPSDPSDGRLDAKPESPPPLVVAKGPEQSCPHFAGVTAHAGSQGFEATETGRCPFLHGVRPIAQTVTECTARTSMTSLSWVVWQVPRPL